MTVPTARDACLHHLSLLARKHPDLAPGGLSIDTLTADGLSPRDAALAVSIEQSVVRYWQALVTIAQLHLTRPWAQLEPNIQAAILGGAAQLLLLDRVPDHAAINESVEWTKRHVRPKAGGLVNAILRRIVDMRSDIADTFDPQSRRQLPLPDGRAMQFNTDVFDDDLLIRLAQQTSHPLQLVRDWRAAHGEDSTRSIALHSLVQPPIIITGVDSAAAHDTDALTEHSRPGFYVFTGNHRALTELLSQHPTARVQDPTSAGPVAATARLQPKIIIDYCAGRGTKTRQLAALHPAAQIIATDTNAERLAALRRSTAASPQITAVETSELSNWSGQASLLVLDVPCSNTGVLARRAEAKHRVSQRTRSDLVALQRQIIADALALLEPAGSLLYSTCSIDPAENEHQIEWLLKWHDFDVSDQRVVLPAGQPGSAPQMYHDGGFHALLNRR